MRKIMVLMLSLVLSVLFVVPAVAQQVDVYEDSQLVKSVVFKIGTPYYVVDNQFPGVKMDVAPFIENDRTFVPVRFLGNALGVDDSKINWDNDTQTAMLKGKAALQMTIGQARVVSDGVATAIDVAPVLRSDRTFLPARFVAEGLGYQVGWDEATQTVICWPAGQDMPDIEAAVEYLNEQTEQAKPVSVGETFTTRAGYQIPKETKLFIPDYFEELGLGDPNNCELDFCLDLEAGDLENQWAHVDYILSQKLDRQTVESMMTYIKQKTNWDQKLPNKFWDTDKKKTCVGSSWGGYMIQITVWYK